jgi:ACT domain-containing protein
MKLYLKNMSHFKGVLQIFLLLIISNNTHSSEGLFVRDGGLDSKWVYVHDNVKKFVVAKNRIAALLNDDTLKVKEGGLSAKWGMTYPNVKSFDVSEKRIGVLLNDGTLRVKEGGMSAKWVNEYGNVKRFKLTDNRIAIQLNDNTLKVKEGGLSAKWGMTYPNVKSFDVSKKRVGALLNDGTLRVKEGGLSAKWVNEHGNVKRFKLTDNRIAIQLNDNTLKVKEGDLSAKWGMTYPNVKSFDLSKKRVGVLLNDGTLRVKEGGLSEKWVDQFKGVVNKFKITDKRVAMTLNNCVTTECIDKYVHLYAPLLKFDHKQGEKNEQHCFPDNAQEYYELNVLHGFNRRSCNSNYDSIGNGNIPTYYQYTVDGNDVYILYSFFYGYQEPCIDNAFKQEGYHNADWEKISVKVSSGFPISINYYQHAGNYTKFNGNFKSYDITHPVVYVGKNSHGSYHDDGGTGGCIYFEDFRNPKKANKNMKTWNNLVKITRNETAPSYQAWMSYTGKWDIENNKIGGPYMTDEEMKNQPACKGHKGYNASIGWTHKTWGCSKTDVKGRF